MPMPEETQRIAKAMGVELASHGSKRLDRIAVLESSVILAVDLRTHRYIVANYPGCSEKTFLLGLFARPQCGEIPDPHGASPMERRRSLDVVASALHGLAQEIQGQRLESVASAIGSQVGRL